MVNGKRFMDSQAEVGEIYIIDIFQAKQNEERQKENKREPEKRANDTNNHPSV